MRSLPVVGLESGLGQLARLGEGGETQAFSGSVQYFRLKRSMKAF